LLGDGSIDWVAQKFKLTLRKARSYCNETAYFKHFLTINAHNAQ